MKKTLLIFSLLCVVSFRLFAGELVIISGPERKACGFLAKHKDKTYLYTSQSAIFGMKLIGVNYSFNAVTFKGKKVMTKGNMEVSPTNDVCRIEVTGKFPETFEIGNLSDLDEEINIFFDAMEKSEETQFDNVKSIGLYSFTFNEMFDTNAAGSPILDSDGKVVGVVSAWNNKVMKGRPLPPQPKADPKKKGKKKPDPPKVDASKFDKRGQHFKSEEVRTCLAARVNPDLEWITTKEADFVTAGDAIHEAYRLQEEFLPLLNWWYQNPYRIIDSDVSYPKDLKRFVKYNNERARRMDVHIKTVRSNPKKHETLLRGLREKCVHRAKLFYAFPNSQKAKMTAPWKTKFLDDQAAKAAENWDVLLPYIKARKRSMEYRLPYKF